jgi:hypothetical protein
MKNMLLLTLLAALTASAETITLECERFADVGGWSIDSQFRSEMGSTYLLAHGLGKPVADAKTSFEVAADGNFSVWVRTRNWTLNQQRKHGIAEKLSAGGRFQVLVNGTALETSFPAEDDPEWNWHRAASALALASGRHEIALRDLDGFDGRCDAIVFTTEARPDFAALRETQTLKRPNAQTTSNDLVVVGGGIAGVCTAISAARLGLKVALVQDRPVLGGANSSEVRVHLGGRQNIGEYPRLGDVVSEIGPARGGNAQPAAVYEDDRKLKAVLAEKNISLHLNTLVDRVDAETGKRIRAVEGVNVVTGERIRFEAPLFADGTGDGTVGALAGADWRIGREGRDETNESLAPEKGDRMTMGASVQWYAKDGQPSSFPAEPWMIRFNESNCEYNMRGDWDWETGMNRDQLADFESVRDYGLLVVYSNWSFVKNAGAKKDKFANASLAWVAFVAGKRETRRLMGDHVLCEQDVLEERPHPDGTCWTTWTIDLHYPMPSNQRDFQGEPFRSIAKHASHYGYPIPYRCFYSRNVENLFMAGRNISVTHVALGTTRVMRTHGMQGEVVGMAAAICRKRGCTPRGVYADHLDELKASMTKGVGNGGIHPPQDYNLGGLKSRQADK